MIYIILNDRLLGDSTYTKCWLCKFTDKGPSRVAQFNNKVQETSVNMHNTLPFSYTSTDR